MVYCMDPAVCFSFKSTIVFFVYSLHLCHSFGCKVCKCSFGFACKIIRKRRGVLRTKGQAGVIARKSVSHQHCHSAWLRTELRRVYGAAGMMDMD
jgi:hypothetical protein